MKLVPHLVTGILLSILLFIIGFRISDILTLFLSSIFIDLDHIQMIVVCKAFTIDKIAQLNNQIYSEYKSHPNTAYLNVIYIFHTIEFNIVLLIFGFINRIILLIFLGFIFHVICDIIHHSLNKFPILRWLSLIIWVNSKSVKN